MEMTLEEKQKSLAKWKWEAKLLYENLKEWELIGIDTPINRHLKIVCALIESAEKELKP